MIVAFNKTFIQCLPEDRGPGAAHQYVLVNCSKAPLFGNILDTFFFFSQWGWVQGRGYVNLKRLCNVKCLKEQIRNILMLSMCERRWQSGWLILLKDMRIKLVCLLLSIPGWIASGQEWGVRGLWVLWHRPEGLQGIFTAPLELTCLTWASAACTALCLWDHCGKSQNFTLFHTPQRK